MDQNNQRKDAVSNEMPMDRSSDVEIRIKEAEVYYAMGLTKESLDTYQSLIGDISSDDSQRYSEVRIKIEALQKEIKNRRSPFAKNLGTEDMSRLRQALSIGDNPVDLFNSATSLKELGFYKEASTQFERLIADFDHPVTEILPDLIACFMNLYSPEKVVERIEAVLRNHPVSDTDVVKIRSNLAKKMERMNQKKLAKDLYDRILQAQPSNKEIKSRIDLLNASISSGSKFDHLLESGLVTPEQLQQAFSIAKTTKKSVEHVLIDHMKINQKEVGKTLASFFGCPFKAFDSELAVPVELISKLKRTFLLHNHWVPLSWEKDGVEILIDNPRDLRKTDHIEALLKTRRIKYSVGIPEDIEKYINHFYAEKKAEAAIGEMSDDLDMILDISFEEDDEPDEDYDHFDEASSQVVKLVDQVIVTAYRKNASDIHVEPSELLKRTDIRYRIDGVCQEYIQVPNSMARAILSRMKIMANLDIAERRLPQDGKIKFKRKGIPPIELRMATLPTTGGYEDAVLRILAQSGAMKLDDTGMNARNLDIMKRIISQPYGLVLVVGPTGSGKTTTLHSALGYINKPGIKIWTAEDPVEITQPGLRQVEIKSKIGLDFARIMRAFLRADPDVIMIGEMRDLETASTGIEASLTGHLVLSTLHTNSAPETITRLLDMGLNPLNFSDAFLGVLAQRLVRRLCKECREAYHPSEEEFEDLLIYYGKQHAERANIAYTPDLILHRPVGCEACSGTGYKGRLGIHEMMHGTPGIKHMIKKAASSEELFVKAMSEGMTTLKQDGIVKALNGLTDISEIKRVCIE